MIHISLHPFSVSKKHRSVGQIWKKMLMHFIGHCSSFQATDGCKIYMFELERSLCLKGIVQDLEK